MFRTRHVPLPLLVITTVLFQLATPVIARADGGVTPPDPQPTAEVPPDGSEVAESDSTGEVPAGLPAASVPPPEPAPTAAEILAQLPDGTVAMVLDESGQAESIVTLEAAEIITTSDPIWCPAGSSPGDPGCTLSQPDVSALLDTLFADPITYSGDGTIFFTTAYSTDDVYINGTDPRTAALRGLGIDGLLNALSVPVAITHWGFPVQLANLDINLGANLDGLHIETTGQIQLTAVSVSGAGNGAYLDNTSGTGAIIVTNSDFSGNSWTGLDARSAGEINLSDVVASSNEYGAYLDASAGTGSISVGASGFMGNAFAGLTARTADGDITLTDVDANNSSDPDSYGAGLTSLNGGTIQTTTSNFLQNGGKGLWVEASGAVDLESTNASGNGLDGVYIHNLNACAGVGGDNILVDGGTYQTNGGYGVHAVLGPSGHLTLSGPIVWGGNGAGDSYQDLSPCPPCVKDEVEPKPFNLIAVPETGGAPVTQNCVDYAGTVLILPNGDRITLVCPVSGEVTLARATGSGLPGELPGGHRYVTGMAVELAEDGAPVQAITEGGFMRVLFTIPEGMEDASLAILYWDPRAGSGSGGWVDLPPYSLRPDGTPMLHRLHPDVTPDDQMRILGGVRVMGAYVKVSVNFPGTFVLVAR